MVSLTMSMLLASYWEAIAVPELRGHAKQVAVGIFNSRYRNSVSRVLSASWRAVSSGRDNSVLT